MKKTYLFIILIIALCLLKTPFPANAGDNYCQDPDTWAEWDALVEKFPGDKDIQTLHALRLGLCMKVERGDLSEWEATVIFENARESIINKKAGQKIKIRNQPQKGQF
jgi:hypothetical protein